MSGAPYKIHGCSIVIDPILFVVKRDVYMPFSDPNVDIYLINCLVLEPASSVESSMASLGLPYLG
jgi:hypothetical protein